MAQSSQNLLGLIFTIGEIYIQCRTGINKISAELKHEGEALDNQIYKLTIKIWRQEEKPEDRETGVIVPVHKKGEKRVVKITEI